MRGLSVLRERKGSLNSCRGPAVGTALPIPFEIPWSSLSRDRWDKIGTPRAILASLPPTTVRHAHAREVCFAKREVLIPTPSVVAPGLQDTRGTNLSL